MSFCAVEQAIEVHRLRQQCLLDGGSFRIRERTIVYQDGRNRAVECALGVWRLISLIRINATADHHLIKPDHGFETVPRAAAKTIEEHLVPAFGDARSDAEDMEVAEGPLGGVE